jgi:molybdopterin molybdotransferase
MLASETVSVQQAAGRVTAAPPQALVDLPPLPSSAMDGFAVRAAEQIAAGREGAGNPIRP